MARRTALITGGGSGIGKEISNAFAGAGYRVVIADRDVEIAGSTAEELSDTHGTEVEARSCNVASATDVAVLATSLAGQPLDVLVNNAGVFDLFEPVESMSAELWQRVLDVNLTGPFLVTQALLPSLRRADAASIVNIASICGLVAGSGGVAYTATKHGVIGLTRQLAYELGPEGMRVNAICPGVIATGMSMPLLSDPTLSGHATNMISTIPSRRTGHPTEVAALAVFLGDQSAGYLNGTAIPVDGGWTAV